MVLDGLQVGHYITTSHGDVYIQVAQFILVQCQDKLGFSIPLAMPISQACYLNSLLSSIVTIKTCHIVAMPSLRMNS